MNKLTYRLTNDTLFKMLFVRHQDLLKKLTAALLGIQLESIWEFTVTNPEMPPEALGEKFSRLDINMTVDGQRVDIEVQVEDEGGDFPERSLYYWAREYSTALGSGKAYRILPRTIVISIVDFKLFPCPEYHSNFQALEVTRHTRLSDRFCLQYFELPKLPDEITKKSELNMWLSLFKAKTEEDFRKLEELEVPFVEQTLEAYRSITATNEFKELERLRALARHNEAAALARAEEKGIERGRVWEREKWQGVVADKDAALEEKDKLLADQKAEIAALMAQLNEKKYPEATQKPSV